MPHFDLLLSNLSCAHLPTHTNTHVHTYPHLPPQRVLNEGKVNPAAASGGTGTGEGVEAADDDGGDCDPHRDTESGQLLIDRGRHLDVLEFLLWINRWCGVLNRWSVWGVDHF